MLTGPQPQWLAASSCFLWYFCSYLSGDFIVSLKIEQLSKVFDQSTKKVLDNLTIEIPKSSFTALLGPSGCGKTTLLRIIAGLDRPSSGKISMDQEIWSDSQAKAFIAPENRNVGMVFQSYAV